MPKSRLCSFCGHDFQQSLGQMFVRNDGTILWFCSSKCRKNSLKLGRDSRKLRWTEYYGKEEKGKA